MSQEDMRGLIQRLHDKRLNIRSQQAELMTQIEATLATGEEAGEDRAKWETLDKEFVTLGETIDRYLTQQEHDKDMDEQRARYEKLVRDPQVSKTMDLDLDERATRWFRSAVKEEDIYTPRSFSVQLRPLKPETHDLTKGTSTAGAELIPTGFVRQLYEHLIEFAAVRQTGATILTTSSGENLLVPKTTGQGAAVLVGEGVALSESDPAYAQVTLNAYKFGQLLQVSRELLEDSAVDILSHIARFTGRALGTVTGTYFTTGTGTSQPQGFTASGTAGVTGGAPAASTAPTANDLIDLYHSVISGYRQNGTWVMNDLTAARLRKLRDDSGGSGLGNFIWQPGLQGGDPDRIFGRPVVTTPDMASTLATNALLIAFGDFSQYFVIRDVNAIRFERSDDYAFATDLVSFRAIMRTDSKQLVNGANGAVKFWKGAAT